jgi:hypothetical protein
MGLLKKNPIALDALKTFRGVVEEECGRNISIVKLKSGENFEMIAEFCKKKRGFGEKRVLAKDAKESKKWQRIFYMERQLQIGTRYRQCMQQHIC